MFDKKLEEHSLVVYQDRKQNSIHRQISHFQDSKSHKNGSDEDKSYKFKQVRRQRRVGRRDRGQVQTHREQGGGRRQVGGTGYEHIEVKAAYSTITADADYEYLNIGFMSFFREGHSPRNFYSLRLRIRKRPRGRGGGRRRLRAHEDDDRRDRAGYGPRDDAVHQGGTAMAMPPVAAAPKHCKEGDTAGSDSPSAPPS